MKRILFLMLLITAVLMGAASAATIRYTNAGGGLSPSNFFAGETALTYHGYNDFGLYRGATNFHAGGTFDGRAFSVQAQRSVDTVGRTSNQAPYRTFEYGDWHVTDVRYKGENKGLYATRNPVTGKYVGSAYYGTPNDFRYGARTSTYSGSYGAQMYRTYQMMPRTFGAHYPQWAPRTPAATVRTHSYYN